MFLELDAEIFPVMALPPVTTEMSSEASGLRAIAKPGAPHGEVCKGAAAC